MPPPPAERPTRKQNGLRPSPRNVVNALATSSNGYERLAENGAAPALEAETFTLREGEYALPDTKPPVFVSMESKGQSTLRWKHPIFIDGVYVPADGLNLYTYPQGYRGAQLELLKGILVHLAAHTNLLEQPDSVGAYPIHALLLADTPEAHDLVLAVLELNPALMLQLHEPTGPFRGEGCLHILCANQREELACRMVEMAKLSFTREQLTEFLTTQADGGFFEAPPMKWYGESPLSYACVFGLRELVKHMLHTGCVRFDTAPGRMCGFYPLHAVAANGNRAMYDWIRNDLSPSLRAGCSDKLIASGKMVKLNVEGMGPLQLTCRLGLRRMFQHIMRKEHTKMLWKWGPVTAYSLNLEGIDSSGDGAADVMEVIGRQSASRVTQSLILDNMMQGFLYKLFQQKWHLYGWFLHYVWCALDVTIITLVVLLGLALKEETEKGLHKSFGNLITLFVVSILCELFVACLYAGNIRQNATVHTGEVLRRTWNWMKEFDIDMKFFSYGLLTVAGLMYLYTDTELVTRPYTDPLANISFPASDALEKHAEALQAAAGYRRQLNLDDEAHGRLLKRAGAAGGKNSLLQAAQFGYDPRDQREIDTAILIEGSEAAYLGGTLPLVWLLMGSGCMLQMSAFVDKFVMPIPTLSTLILSVKSTLRGELIVFMFIFLMGMATFFISMFIMYPRHNTTPILPQAPDFAAAWSGAEAMVLLAFIGQPFDFNLNPAGVHELGEWQAASLALFTCFYYFYVFFALILLLNLLIALLGDSFAKTQQESILQGRIAFARCVLRLELIAHFLKLQTRAGELQGGEYVHVFREVARDPLQNEVSVDEPDENIFDNLSADTPEWATRLMAKLDALPKEATDMLMHEIAEGDRLRETDAKGGSAVAAARRSEQLPPPAALPAPTGRKSPSAVHGERSPPQAMNGGAVPRKEGEPGQPASWRRRPAVAC